MTNNVVLIGRLVRDVDLRQTSTGKMMTYFTLAVNRNFKNEQGEQAADFIGCKEILLNTDKRKIVVIANKLIMILEDLKIILILIWGGIHFRKIS